MNTVSSKLATLCLLLVWGCRENQDLSDVLTIDKSQVAIAPATQPTTSPSARNKMDEIPKSVHDWVGFAEEKKSPTTKPIVATKPAPVTTSKSVVTTQPVKVETKPAQFSMVQSNPTTQMVAIATTQPTAEIISVTTTATTTKPAVMPIGKVTPKPLATSQIAAIEIKENPFVVTTSPSTQPAALPTTLPATLPATQRVSDDQLINTIVTTAPPAVTTAPATNPAISPKVQSPTQNSSTPADAGDNIVKQEPSDALSLVFAIGVPILLFLLWIMIKNRNN